MPTTLDEISKLKQQIAQLTTSAIDELNTNRNRLQEELKTIDAELEKLTGKPTRRKRQSRHRLDAAPQETGFRAGS